MSYETMDHAGWVQSNIAHGKAMTKKPPRNSMGQAVGWHAAPDRLNAFQARAMDMLGIVFGGIYNAPITWNRVEWRDGSLHVPIRAGTTMATWDGSGLTRLVLLAHMARIRVDIAVHGRGWMLSLWPRSHDGGMSQRHPSLMEAVEAFEGAIPAGHRIRYQPDVHDPLPVWRMGVLETLANGRWVKDARAAIERRDAKEAGRYIGYLESDVERAREIAGKLGRAPEHLALAARVETHLAEAKAHLAEMLGAAA